MLALPITPAVAAPPVTVITEACVRTQSSLIIGELRFAISTTNPATETIATWRWKWQQAKVPDETLWHTLTVEPGSGAADISGFRWIDIPGAVNPFPPGNGDPIWFRVTAVSSNGEQNGTTAKTIPCPPMRKTAVIHGNVNANASLMGGSGPFGFSGDYVSRDNCIFGCPMAAAGAYTHFVCGTGEWTGVGTLPGGDALSFIIRFGGFQGVLIGTDSSQNAWAGYVTLTPNTPDCTGGFLLHGVLAAAGT